jgi:glycosyltransferase involved in cell wall biosynthesis
MKYSIITPTKNEGKYIEETIRSVIAQQIKPCEWFIMDDDSTDNTSQIINKYLNDFPFIRHVKLNHFRKELTNTGGRVAAIINHADILRTVPVEILAKIDADTSFAPDFFQNIVKEFTNDPLLGIASGHLVENGVPEIIKDPTSGRGASLIIRHTCFVKIGKFFESKTRGEDVLAFVAVRALGYKTRTFDYYFNHLKPEGIRKSKLKNHYITGYYKGSIPYWLPFFLANLVRDLFKKPYVLGSAVQFYSYCLSRYILQYKPFPAFVSRKLWKEQKIKIRHRAGLRKN